MLILCITRAVFDTWKKQLINTESTKYIHACSLCRHVHVWLPAWLHRHISKIACEFWAHIIKIFWNILQCRLLILQNTYCRIHYKEPGGISRCICPHEATTKSMYVSNDNHASSIICVFKNLKYFYFSSCISPKNSLLACTYRIPNFYLKVHNLYSLSKETCLSIKMILKLTDLAVI